MTEIKMHICGCVKDTGKYLHDVFKNIEQICSILNDYHIIIAYDTSTDNSLEILRHYKEKYKSKFSLIIGEVEPSEIRTENIANARNSILNEMLRLGQEDFHYFSMIDMDDVCAKHMNIDVLKHIIDKERTTPLEWDALSFNKTRYYDLWALSIYPYTFSVLHYQHTYKIKQGMLNLLQKQFTNAVKTNGNNGLVNCLSAFNGFAIYRTNKFKNVRYEWNVRKLLEIYPKQSIDIMSKHVWQEPKPRLDDCEHRYYHIRASLLNKARICISPMCLFQS